ncbi:MAG: TolC family protein [Desulfobacteraceae bacterium]|nr:TolC family protein [Desulfobacteraceae bacterium]
MSKPGIFCFVFSAALALGVFLPQTSPAENNGVLTLEQACRTAMDENENIQISRQEMRKAEHDITSATSALYPQLSVRGAYTREKEFDMPATGAGGAGGLNTPYEYGTLSLNLDQHIYQWGKVWSGREMARHYYDGSRLRHIRQIQEILYQVSVRYYEALLANRSIEIAETALNRAVRQAEQARARFEAGVTTRTDVLRAEVQVAQSREELERAKNDYNIALERLALEMGIESAPENIKEPEELLFEEEPVSELFEKAMANRRDLYQAQKQLAGAENRVEFEKADFFPNISLTGQYTRTDEKDLFYGEKDDWKASVVVSYPLFTGWKNSAEIDKARADKNQAQYRLARLRKQIRNEVKSVYLDIRTQQKVIAQLEKQVDSAKRNYQQTTARFKQGLVTAVDQVDAFTALNEAENRLAQAYYTYQLDVLRLEMATGTFQSDLLEKETVNNETG